MNLLVFAMTNMVIVSCSLSVYHFCSCKRHLMSPPTAPWCVGRNLFSFFSFFFSSLMMSVSQFGDRLNALQHLLTAWIPSPTTSSYIISLFHCSSSPKTPHTRTHTSVINGCFSCSWLAWSSLVLWLSPRAGTAKWWQPSWSSSPPLCRCGTPRPSAQTQWSDCLAANKNR